MELLSGPTDAILSIGTRKSVLARAQADQIATFLENAWPELLKGKVAIKGLVPLGDKDKTTALWDFSTEQQQPAASTSKVMPPLGRQSDAKGLWTNELEDALEEGGVDVIVHCVKDMPTTVPVQFALGAITAREDPRDVCIMHPDLLAHIRKNNPSSHVPSLADIPDHFIIGTSSLRRTAQLRRIFPRLEFEPLRGNVPTRLAKLDESVLAGIASPEHTSVSKHGKDAADADQSNSLHPPFAAIIVAAAGIHRLGLTDRITSYLLPTERPPASEASASSDASILYAVGQGALCLEIRVADDRVRRLVEPLICPKTTLACTAERSMLRALEGGCSVPVGTRTTWSTVNNQTVLAIEGVVVNVSGEKSVDAEGEVVIGDIPSISSLQHSQDSYVSFLDQTPIKTLLELCEKLGRDVAQKLVDGGASVILDEIKGARK